MLTKRRYSNDDTYILWVDLPGFTQEAIDIQFKDRVLTIKGQRYTAQDHPGRYYRQERARGAFVRHFTFGKHTGWTPHMDVIEADNAYVIEADLPGMAIEDIDVQIEANRLLIAGERKSEQHGHTSHYTHFERTYGKFQRAFTLPESVDVNAVEAQYANGVLTVNVPKSAEARSKRIAIQAA